MPAREEGHNIRCQKCDVDAAVQAQAGKRRRAEQRLQAEENARRDEKERIAREEKKKKDTTEKRKTEEVVVLATISTVQRADKTGAPESKKDGVPEQETTKTKQEAAVDVRE